MFVTNISPTNMFTGQTAEVWVNGLGFTGQVGITIAGLFIPTFFVSPTNVKFVLPYIPVGTYDLTVVNGDDNFTSFTMRSALTITDPVATSIGTLGGADLPMVLPPILVESACTSALNGSVDLRSYLSSAVVYSNPATGETTATKTIDSSGVASQPVIDNATSSASGQVVESPFGTFVNP